MRLKDLLEGILDARGLGIFADVEIPSVWDDSRRVTPGSLFAALPPVARITRNGDAFIADAVSRGAKVIILPEESSSRFLDGDSGGVYFLHVKDPRAVFHAVAGRFYGSLSRQVRVMGVTGTNGKTTITYFLESVLGAAGLACGVVGTVNRRVGTHVIPSKNTTPGFLDNQIFLADIAAEGVGYAVMEVSSHALAQGRVDGIDFIGGIFTNLTGDHLDEHGTMEAYFQAKARLFSGLASSAFAVINVDDAYGRRLVPMTPAKVLTYALDRPADITVRIDDFSLAGTRFCIILNGQEFPLVTHFIGRHNIYNMLAAFAAGIGAGFPPDVVCRGIENLSCVPGRLERVVCGQDFCVFIDYAHTDDGLQNVLNCLKIVPHGRLILVFGCGGDRDRTKRPRMGRVACELADHVFLTSDNPRSEDPDAIIAEIVPAFSRPIYTVIPDRGAAIGAALAMARKNDIVLLAGKGHETTQILRDGVIDFNERDIVSRILGGRG